MSKQSIETCNQVHCGNPSAYRFTWPGEDEAGICEAHSGKLRAVAQGMGMHIQLIPIAASGEQGE